MLGVSPATVPSLGLHRRERDHLGETASIAFEETSADRPTTFPLSRHPFYQNSHLKHAEEHLHPPSPIKTRSVPTYNHHKMSKEWSQGGSIPDIRPAKRVPKGPSTAETTASRPFPAVFRRLEGEPPPGSAAFRDTFGTPWNGFG